MAKGFKDAIARNRQASEELEQALRECLRVINDKPDVIVEGRFRVLTGGRRVVGK